MAIGYLIIQARTAHDALPLSGVQIRIMDHQEKIIYELTTDESGPYPWIQTFPEHLLSATMYLHLQTALIQSILWAFRFWKAKRPFSPSNLFRCGNSSAPLP